MKREYTDPKKDTNPNNTAMFSNLHRHLLQPYSTSSSSSPPIHFPHHQHQHQNPFPFPVINREVDDESSSGGAAGTTPNHPTHSHSHSHSHSQPDPKSNNNNSNDGATIEVQRRPRGRPPGSKNKPKPPVIITRELPDPIMSPYILEISNSADVIDSVAKFARRRNTGLCILHASGAVANVTIRQPSPNSSSTVTFHGLFDILSLDATFLTPAQMPKNANLNVAVSLSIPQGQIIGGIVAGPLIAAGTVYVVAASFSNPSFERLPIEDQDGRTRNNNVNERTTSSGGNEHEQQSASGGASGDNNNGGGGGMYGSCGMGASDVIWAPTPRQPF